MKTNRSHPQQSLTEAIKALLLGGAIALGASTAHAKSSSDPKPADALGDRIRRVREQLGRAAQPPAVQPGSDAQPIDGQQTMWWRNWGNWHNGGWGYGWPNWPNWHNGWRNWHNWGNW